MTEAANLIWTASKHHLGPTGPPIFFFFKQFHNSDALTRTTRHERKKKLFVRFYSPFYDLSRTFQDAFQDDNPVRWSCNSILFEIVHFIEIRYFKNILISSTKQSTVENWWGFFFQISIGIIYSRAFCFIVVVLFPMSTQTAKKNWAVQRRCNSISHDS